MITPECQRACIVLAGRLNYGLRVVQAWALAESGGGTNVVPATPHNYWNVGNTDSNPSGGSSWPTPEAAGEGTYQWLVANPASGKLIIAAGGHSEQDQLQALWTSPFSSSRYGPPGHPGQWLLADYSSLPPTRPPLPKGAAVFDPPLQIKAILQSTIGGGAYGLFPDGGIALFGNAVDRGNVHGKTYFAGRVADHLEWPTAPAEIQAAQAQGWGLHDCHVTVATSGERYGPIYA